MNQRKAKAIRRLANSRTIGYPERVYENYETPFYVKGVKVRNGVPRRLAKCTRLYMKALKKAAAQ